MKKNTQNTPDEHQKPNAQAQAELLYGNYGPGEWPGIGNISRPTLYRPTSPKQLVGSAKHVGQAVLNQVHALRPSRTGSYKALFHGPPGGGKSTLAEMIAGKLGSGFDIQSIAGHDVCVEVVRGWEEQAHYYPSDSTGYFVKLVDEINEASEAAKGLLLSLFDRAPSYWACIGTANITPKLTDRLWSRFQLYYLKPPTKTELAELLHRLTPLPRVVLEKIAKQAEGNVRAALAQAEVELALLQFRRLKSGREGETTIHASPLVKNLL